MKDDDSEIKEVFQKQIYKPYNLFVFQIHFRVNKLLKLKLRTMKTLKKFLVVFVSIAAVLLISSCASIYKSPNLSTAKQNHKTIAILPFDITIEPNKIPKNATADYIKQTETVRKENTELLHYTTQKSLYAFTLKKEKKFKYPVHIQDIEETNQLLSKAGISPENIKSYKKSEIAEICKVDAVITGSINLPPQGYNVWRQYLGWPLMGASFVFITLADPAISSFGWIGYFASFSLTSSYGRCVTYDVNLYDGKTNELLWKYNNSDNIQAYSINSGVGIEQVTMKLPYRKK